MFALFNTVYSQIESVGGVARIAERAEDLESEVTSSALVVKPLGDAIALERQRRREHLDSARRERETLVKEIRTWLKEQAEGALEPEIFIREHEELAALVDFEFESERTFIVSVEVTAKVRIGFEPEAGDLDVTFNDTDGFEVQNWDIEDVTAR